MRLLQTGYRRIRFHLQLLDHFLKVGISASDLLLDKICALLWIATDITRNYSPYYCAIVVGVLAEGELVAVLWPRHPASSIQPGALAASRNSSIKYSN